MKVLIVTGIFPPDLGGPASYVPEIGAALSARHLISGAVTLSDAESFDDSAFPFPVVRILRRQNRLLRWIKTVLAIRRLSSHADVVYLNGLVLEGIIACRIIGRKPTVVKIVGDLVWERARNSFTTTDTIDVFQTRSHGIRWDFLKSLQIWYVGLADTVIVPSRYLRDIVSGWGIHPGKIRVIYNSVRAITGIRSDSSCDCIFDLVTVARLVPWKGLPELIRIADENNWILNIIGDGPLRESLERQVSELKNPNVIRFTGNIPRSKVWEEIAISKVFVLNSSYEGLPHVVLEAKALGVPVVATAVGGTPETINHGEDGILTPLGDLVALSENIRFLLEHPEERIRIGMAGKKQAEEFFSFESMVAETESTLISTAEAGKRCGISKR